MATVRRPSSVAARMIRIAISLRLRARSFFPRILRISWNSRPVAFVIKLTAGGSMHTKMVVLMAIAAMLPSCDVDGIDLFGDSHAYRKDFHYSYPLKPGGRISLENFNGAVEISGWAQDKVEIEGTQYAASPGLRDSIKINGVASGDSVQSRTV